MTVFEGREFSGDFQFSAEVCVVGSGAGGAMMARDLAAVGVDVCVLEMGAYSKPPDFNRIEDEMLERLFQERGARATSDLAVKILQGHGVGGSTVHNTCLCKRTPPELLDHWADELGVSGARAVDLADAFLRTEDELSVRWLTEPDLNANNSIFKRGVEALGWRGGYLQHNREGCIGSGYCELGCPFDGKQNALKVLIPKVDQWGGTILSDARAERVLMRGGRAAGVAGTLLDADGRPHASFRIDAKAVCLAGSAIGSAALHQRSALPDPSGQAGRNLRVHPGAVVAGLFEERVDGWKGIPQSYECTEFLSFDPHAEHRVWLLPVFAHPIGTAVQIPGFGAEHWELMRQYPHVAALTAMVHDHTKGRVRVARNGRIRVDYEPDASDRAQLAFGLAQGAKILLAAGAKVVLIPYETNPLRIERVEDVAQVEARGAPRYDLPLVAVHPMGTLRMGDDPRRAVVSSRGEHHAVKNLFVCDGSLFPTSIGVPPQISIYTFARHIAPHVAAAVGK